MSVRGRLGFGCLVVAISRRQQRSRRINMPGRTPAAEPPRCSQGAPARCSGPGSSASDFNAQCDSDQEARKTPLERPGVVGAAGGAGRAQQGSPLATHCRRTISSPCCAFDTLSRSPGKKAH